MPSKMSIMFYCLATLVAAYWVFLFISTHTATTVPDLFDHFDKVLHFSAYAVLAFLLTTIIFFRWGLLPRIGIWVWTLTILYGSLDEYTQQFVPGREPELLDLIADTCGAALGVCAAYGLAHLCMMLHDRWDINSKMNDIVKQPSHGTAK
jgi:VanZ family protein